MNVWRMVWYELRRGIRRHLRWVRCSAKLKWSVHDGMARTRTKTAGVSLGACLDFAQDRDNRTAADGCGCLSDTGRAQGDRLDADPYRPEPCRLFRPVAAAGRRLETFDEGNHRAVRCEQISVYPGT